MPTVIFSNLMRRIKQACCVELSRHYDLTSNEIAVIAFLGDVPNASATEIGNNLGFRKSHVSLSVDSLCKRGYLKKEADPDNRKLFHHNLCKKADPVLADIAKKKIQIEEIFFRGFTEEEKKSWSIYMKRIVDNIHSTDLWIDD